MKIRNSAMAALLGIFAFLSCSDEEKPSYYYPDTPEYDMTGFAKGADVSWLTEMEKAGLKFYDAEGKARECMELLRESGMNSVRLRVWVHPSDGWCNAEDVLVKAWRAQRLGMRILIDFHYSDSWADPGQQNKPAAWADLDFNELKEALATHTAEVLTLLKENSIDVEWIQIGNETMNGMLWEDGKLTENMDNYAQLNNAGYDAAKGVYPEAKVMIHFDRGHRNDMYRVRLDGLKQKGAKWDVIGMSLYPETSNWQELTEACYNNMLDMVKTYGSEVMICEVGMSWDEAETAKLFLTELIKKTREVPGNKGLGVFYWEPQAYGSWKSYSKGAFDNEGKPTVALEAFR